MINTYQVDEKRLEGIIGITAVCVIAFFWQQPPFALVIFASVVGGITVTVALRWEYTYSIKVDVDNQLATFITKSRTNTEIDICPLKEIYFTYRKRSDFYGTRRGTFIPDKRKILQIDNKRKTLALLVPGQDGWNDRMISELANNLVAAGVKRVIDKYNSDEIVL